MAAASSGTAHPGSGGDEPLLSNRLLTRATIAIAALAGLSLAISVGGRILGERIALAGHSESTELFDIVIGQDQIRLPANVMRFEEQRRTGLAERADLYLTWPEMRGYSAAERTRFNDVAHAENLIFLHLSQSTMSKDMSGRLEPIYSQLFEGPAEPGPAGLSLHRLKANSGYGEEVFFTARLKDGSDYAVRCMLPEDDSQSTGADCQRDIHVGRDLSVLYRFSSRLLPQWQSMEARIRAYLDRAFVLDGRTGADKRRRNAQTNDSS